MFCPKCGVQLASDVSPFCTQCGAPVKASVQVPADQAVAPAPLAVPGIQKTGTKRWLWGALVMVGVGVLVVLGSQTGNVFPSMNSAVDVVRNGFLKDYNTTTVGKAFEGTFQNAKWSSFVTPKHVTVVQFDGTISAEALEAGHFYPTPLGHPSSFPVKFQFVLSADKSTFHVGYIDPEPFRSAPDPYSLLGAFSEERTLKFVYQ